VPINLVKSDPLQDYEKFQFEHAQKPYLEFPILESGAYTDNESPGADRVIIGSISTDYSSAIFCAVITHDGSTKNGFTECKDDTVNTDGKGTWSQDLVETCWIGSTCRRDLDFFPPSNGVQPVLTREPSILHSHLSSHLISKFVWKASTSSRSAR
jgi:hypothetical protein